jgi:hypothetical protein
MEDEEMRNYIKDNWKAFLATRDLPQLQALRKELRSVVIEYASILRRVAGSQTKQRRLQRSWIELIDEGDLDELYERDEPEAQA